MPFVKFHGLLAALCKLLNFWDKDCKRLKTLRHPKCYDFPKFHSLIEDSVEKQQKEKGKCVKALRKEEIAELMGDLL